MVQVMPVQRGIVHVALCGPGLSFQTIGHPSSGRGAARERKCISEHLMLSHYPLLHLSSSLVVFSSEHWSSTSICSPCPVTGRSRKKQADPDLEWAWEKGTCTCWLLPSQEDFRFLSVVPT